MRTALCACVALFAASAYSQGIITTVAGTDLTYPSGPFPANSVSFGDLSGVAVSPITGKVYFASFSRSLIVEFDPAKNTTAVVAGIGIGANSGDGGPAVNAALNNPQQLAFDSAGNLYIANVGAGIRKIDNHGIITTVVANSNASGVAVRPDGSFYFSSGNRIVRVDPSGARKVIAGNGQPGYSGDGGLATAALLNNPYTVAFDGSGNLFFSDSGNYRIRRIGTDGIITTVAGNGKFGGPPVPGPATATALSGVNGIAIDRSGSLFAAGPGSILKVDLNGALSVVSFSIFPNQITVDASGTLYWTDFGYDGLYRLPPGGTAQLLAGYAPTFGIGDNGPALSAGLSNPAGLGRLPDGSVLIADEGNKRVRRLTPSGTITTIAGNGGPGPENPGPATLTGIFGPLGAVSDTSGNVYVANGRILRITPNGTLSIFNTDPTDPNTTSVALDNQGNLLAGVPAFNLVRKVTPDGKSSIFAGTGQAGFSGDGGPATSATFNTVWGVTVCPDGNVYIADRGNNRIRRVDARGIVATVAGGGSTVQDGGPATRSSLGFLTGLACDQQGNLYLTDLHRVRQITPDGVIHAVAGGFQPGFGGDGGPATSALLNTPQGVAVDAPGNVYISDSLNNRIRKILAARPTLTVSKTQVTIPGASQGPATPTSVSVGSSVQGLAYSVTVATADGGGWLSVGSPQGQAPGLVTILADPGNLQPGTYQGTVTLTSPYAPNTLTIAVTFQVGAPRLARLSLQTQSLSFSFTAGGAQSSQQFSVSNQGSGAISFTASAATTTGGVWLNASPPSGSASDTAPAYVNVTATPGNLTAGTYSGLVTVSSPDTKESITIPVTMSISAAQQKILLSQTGLMFTSVAQGGTPLPQNFGILNIGAGSMSWTASTSTLSGGGWLTVDQTGGTVPRPFLDVSLVNVGINPAGLAAGDYYGQIQVRAVGAANSPQSISVVLNVLAAGSNPGPEMRPTGVIFIGTPGNSPGSQSVMVSNPGAASVDYGSSVAYIPGGGWLQYLPSNATVTPGQPVKLILQPDLTNLQPGVQRAAVTLAFSDGSIRNVSVLNVVAPGAGSGRAGREAAAGCTTLLVHPTTLTDATATVTAGQPVTLAVRVADNCGDAITNSDGAVTATFSNADPPVSLVHVGSGNWSGTWTPRNAAQPRVTIQFTAFYSQGTQLYSAAASVPVTLQAGAQPLTFGAANAASGVGTYIAPGGLVSIYGQQLAASAAAGASPFPTQLNGTQVLMGGKPLPLRYVDAVQVNAQVPFDLGINSQQQLIVQRGATLSVPQDLIVAATQPAVYTQDQSGKGAGVIVNGITNALITAANPANAGDVVVLYCNGLGAVNAQSQTVNPLAVTIGGFPAQVNYAGLAPGFPDLYQVNAVVPSGVPAGNAVPVVLTIAGQISPPVTMAVK